MSTFPRKEKCGVCPRRCEADRSEQGRLGYCGGGLNIKIARAALHFWEEPCISGTRGSGTIFFSGCPLKCVYCQNHRISHENYGAEITVDRLRGIFSELQKKGAHNINLVSPTQYAPLIAEALSKAKDILNIPVVYNTGGYETVETIAALDGLIDIYLPDLKYHDDRYSLKYSKAADYFSTAIKAISEMVKQRGKYIIDGNGMMSGGVMIRHLVIPGLRHDSIKILRSIKENFGGSVLVSIMGQYTPNEEVMGIAPLNRRLCTFEYESVCEEARRLGFEGYAQELNSADKAYIPEFNFEGVFINERTDIRL